MRPERSEIRIIPMSEQEYKDAMNKYTSSIEEVNYYRSYSMNNFDMAYMNGMEIAASDDLGTQYYAVIVNNNGKSVDNELYELPESFVNDLSEWF